MTGKTYGLAGSLLLVQRKAKETHRQGWKNCNVIVNHIRSILISISTMLQLGIMSCYVMLELSGSKLIGCIFGGLCTGNSTLSERN